MAAGRPPAPSTRRGYLTTEEVLALPRPLVDLVTAGRAARMSRETAYRRAKAGDFPVPVLRVGHTLMVRTHDLHQFLGLEPLERQAAPAIPPRDAEADARKAAWIERNLAAASELTADQRDVIRRVLRAPTETTTTSGVA